MANEPVDGPLRTSDISPEGQDAATVRAVWQEQLGNLKLYHGTSREAAKLIKANGFSPTVKPYDTRDLLTLDNMLRAHGITVPKTYSEGREGTFHVTSILRHAVNYAIDGPEILDVHILTQADRLLDDSKEGRPLNVTPDEKEILHGIKKRAIAILNRHIPALLELDANSPTIKAYIANKLGTDSPLYDADTFVRQTLEDYKRDSSLSLKWTAELNAGNIAGTLNDFEIDRGLAPEEIGSAIMGDELYALSFEASSVGEILQSCFTGMEKHPPRLIRLIERFDGGSVGEKQLFYWANYFGFTPEEARTLLERTIALKLQKSARR